ncbi:MAG: TrmH family RNA methyltransferase [Bryobacterales bacterium]|nr:TrmH family RNA methyltransferase [Acidobacteriota bacterium]MCB9384746.1 TrmH family RNA methyltransferase [Bryobacterales bacterium]
MEAQPFRALTLAKAYDAIPRVPASIVLENVRSLYNVGSFFRTGDASGLEKLYLSGYTGFPPHRGIAKVALGAEDSLPWERAEDPVGLVEKLRAQGRQIAVIETVPRAVDLYDWNPAFPVAVVFGNEVDGVTPALSELADVHVRIPMLGAKQSLNVAVAGGVVMFELLRKYRALHERAARLAV